VGPSLGKHWASPKKMKSCAFQVRGGKNGGDNLTNTRNYEKKKR